MSNVQVEAWELQLVDPSRNHNKFYRLFVIGNLWAKQWGAIGSVGQWQFKPPSNPGLCRSDAQRQSDEKEAEGYRRCNPARVVFNIPDIWMSELLNHKPQLDQYFRQAGGHIPTTPMGPNDMSEADVRAEAKMLATLDQLEKVIGEPEPPAKAPQPAATGTAPAPTSMEAKLAAAVAKRKAAAKP